MADTLTSRRLDRRLVPVSALLIVVATSLISGQSPDPKGEFVRAIGQFSLGQEGSYGDEGRTIRASLDAMTASLERWEATIRTYESAMAADLRTAEPPLALRMHLALAGVYLDRGRATDALRELAAARQIDPSQAAAVTFEALAHRDFTGNEASAAAALRRAAVLKPEDSITAYLLARQLGRTGNATEEAELAFTRFRANALKDLATTNRDRVSSPFPRLGLTQESPGVEPFFPLGIYADGFADLQRGNFAEAIAGFRTATARDPLISDPGIEAGALARAASSLRDGSIDSALQNVKVAIELAPDRAEPRRVLGLIHLADRQLEDAIDAFTTAITLNPRDERARLGLATAFVESGRLDDARRTLQDALKAIPASGRARYHLGLVYQRQGLYADAVRELTIAARLTPLLGLNSIYQTLGALARAQQDYDAAIAAFSRRVELVPNDAEAHQELGDMYFRQGRHPEALAEFTAALMIDPKRTASHAAIGQVFLRDGRYEDAVAAARQAVTLDATHKEARYVLATSLIRLGNADEGKQQLEIYQRLQSDATAKQSRQLEIEGYRRDAVVSMASGAYEKAIDLLKRALERDPDSATSHMDLGIALLKAGRAPEAVEPLTAAVAQHAGADAHGYLADAYDALGRADDSRRERAIYQQMRQDALRRTSAGR